MASLIETNKRAYEYCESTHKQLNQICAPLLNLGIDHFSYVRIMKDGQFLVLYTNLIFLQDWLFKPGGFGDIFVQMYEKQEKKSYAVGSYDELSLQKDRTYGLLTHHQVTNSFHILKRDKEELAAYHFNSTAKDSLFSTFYFQNIDRLEHFVRYFEERAKKLINTTDKNKLANFHQKLNIPLSFPEKDFIDHKINQFLLETQFPGVILKKNKEEIKLTKREGEYLYHLSRGYRFKEIGQILKITDRAVESCLGNLRKKTGYRSREELIVQFKQKCLFPQDTAEP